MDINGRSAVVTGGDRGLGRATALSLAERGAMVTITYKSDVESAEEVKKIIDQAGGRCNVLQLDLLSLSSVDEFAEELLSLGVPDILVNNAGEIRRPGKWDTLTGAALDATITANLTGHLRVVQKIVPDMKIRGGVVINIASIYALSGSTGATAYAAAKAGLISATYSLARDLGPKNIRVNAVAPGNFDTAMTADASPEFKERTLAAIPLGRLGRPAEIGHAVVYLAEADYVTGHVLVIDGGNLLHM